MKRKDLYKFKKYIIYGFLIIFLIFSGCSTIGTKTIYKSKNINSYFFAKIGYSQPANSALLDKIRPNTSKIYQLAVEEFFTNQTIKVEKFDLSNFELIEKIDTSEIKKICMENSLDGYFCTQIKYKFVDNYYMYFPIGVSEDAYVEIILFDKNGNQIIHTMHNTFAGNSYMMPPKAEMTIKDGTIGALKPILKEIEQNVKISNN